MSTLERSKLGWGELGGVGGGRLGSRGKEIEKRKVEEEHQTIASVLPSWGQQPSHEPLKLIWLGVECLLPHFLHLMPAHSPLCSVCLSLTMWALLGTGERTQCSISQAPYQGLVSNCSCLINRPKTTEHSQFYVVCQGRNTKTIPVPDNNMQMTPGKSCKAFL